MVSTHTGKNIALLCFCQSVMPDVKQRTMRKLSTWRNLDLFLTEAHAALAVGEPFIEIWKIKVALRRNPSLKDCSDDRIPSKNAFEYHRREIIAKACEEKSMWNMAALEWKGCALERAENCVAVSASLDHDHLKAIEFCVQRAKDAWFKFSGIHALPSTTTD